MIFSRTSLRQSLRHLFRQKLYTLINVSGIAIGFACCLLIGIYLQNEWSYDGYHQNKSRLFRLAMQTEDGSLSGGMAKVSFPWAESAKAEIPEIEEICRFMFYGNALFDLGNEQFYQNGGLYADSTVQRLFSWQVISGDAKRMLVEPNSIVLTESLARRCFGSQDPLDKSLTIDQDNVYRVTGVISDIPGNSHFTFEYLVSMSGYSHPDLYDWVRWQQFYTYLLLKPGASPGSVHDKMDDILDKNLEAGMAAVVSPLLQPITSIHLNSHLHREMAVNGNKSYIYIFGFVALFILIIACLNFINLTTARAVTRAKEVGVRKVVGASKWQLIRYFMIEASIVCCLGAVFAIFLSSRGLPFLNEVLNTNIRFDWLNNPTLIIGFGIVLFSASALSGIYPAFVLARFKPRKIIHDLSQKGGRNIRQGLVVFQFVVATFLIIATLVTSGQLDFIQNKNLGFDKDQIVVIPMPDQEMIAHAERYKETFRQIPGVINVSASANRPGGSDYGVPYDAVGVADENQPPMRCLTVDFDFLDTYGMEMAIGRPFSEEMATDTAAYIINEEAARQLGWENPLEHSMAMPVVDRGTAPVIGVVRDFHFRSIHEKIGPLYMFIEPTWFSQFSVKMASDHIEGTLSALEEAWSDLEPDYPFQYFFFDEAYGNMYVAEVNTSKMIRWFSYIAIFITCLGIFGLSTFIITQRTKEIGIRKILGASPSRVVSILTTDFLKLVLIAFVIASPLAWYFMSQWLESFAYRIPIYGSVFTIAGVLVLIITTLSISFQSIRAVMANPADSLRDE